MNTIHLDPNQTFRAAPDFDLILFDALASAEQDRLGDLQRDEQMWGVAREKDSSNLHVLSCETALLLLSLQQPARLPGFCRAGVNRDALLALVLDGMLEVESGEGFVSRAAALKIFDTKRLGEASSASGSAGYLADLSLRALRYGAGLGLSDVPSLSGRLYGYHRLPRCPRWERRLPDAAAVLNFLGIDEGGALKQELDRTWIWGRDDRTAWLSWRRRQAIRRLGRVDRENQPSYKLYVSPRPDDLPRAFAELLAVLPRTRAQAFKTGSDAWGLLRPDKLVIYFSSFEDLEDGAEKLNARLSGFAVHGVPFTPGITRDGLLSWGMDPPSSDRNLPEDGGKSWRRWVVDRLALALIAGQGSLSLALERLRIAGVDVDTWTPSLKLFQPSYVEA